MTNCNLFRTIRTAIIFCLAIIPVLSDAQIINVPGISGITFNKTANDYSNQLTGTFTVHNQVFTPDSLYLHFTASSGHFLIQGKMHTFASGNMIRLNAGTGAPGIRVEGDTLNILDLPVSAEYTVAGVKFKPVGGNSELRYNFSNGGFELNGNADATVDGEILAGGHLGQDSTPGLLIQNNSISRLFYYLNVASVSLYGIELANTTITMKLDAQQTGANKFYAWGTASGFVIDGKPLNVKFGDHSNPAIVITNGKFDLLSLVVSEAPHLLNAFPLLSDMGIKRESGKWIITGELDISFPLGEMEPALKIVAQGDGIQYHTNTKKLSFNDAQFSIGGIELGEFELSDVTLSVVNNAVSGIAAECQLPVGVILDVDFSFSSNPFAFTGIDVEWTAASPEEAIPMGETGLSLVNIGGGMQNIGSNSKRILNANAGFIYGEGFQIPGEEDDAYPFYLNGNIMISVSEFKLTMNALIAAIQDGNSWSSKAGKGTLALDIKGSQMELTGNLKLPNDPLVNANMFARINSKGMVADINADLQIPHSVPFIGGKKLEGVGGALKVDYHSASQSYAAAWAFVDFGFKKSAIGARSTFSGDFKMLGSQQVKSIRNDIKRTTSSHSGSHTCTWYKSVYIPDQAILPYYLQVDVRVVNHQNVRTDLHGLTYHLTSPLGNLWCEEVQFTGSADLHRSSNGTWSSYVNTPLNQDSVFFVAGRHEALAHSSDGNSYFDHNITLPSGNYEVAIQGTCPSTDHNYINDFEINVTQMFPPPSVGVHNKSVTYNAHWVDSTVVSVYTSLYRDGRNGVLIDRFPYSSEAQKYDGPFTRNFTITPGIMIQDKLYYYAVIDDHINSPVKSNVDSLVFTQKIRLTTIQQSSGGPYVPIDSVIYSIRKANDSTATSIRIVGKESVYATVYNLEEGAYILDVTAIGNSSVFPVWRSQIYGGISSAYTDQIKAFNWRRLNFYFHSSDIGVLDFRYDNGILNYHGSVVKSNHNYTVGTKLVLVNSQNQRVDSAISSIYGFSFYNHATGNYTLRVSLQADENDQSWPLDQIVSEDMLTADFPFVYSGTPLMNNITTQAGVAIIYGKVTDNNGNPAAGAQVSLVKQGTNPPISFETHTNDLGYYYFLSTEIGTAHTYYEYSAQSRDHTQNCPVTYLYYNQNLMHVNISLKP